MKKLFSLFALCASFLYAEIYLVDGVDLDDDSTYYDFEKVMDDTDDGLCWAYSAANVLQWWQDKQDASYISLNLIPNGNTYDDAYVSDIVSTFVASWENLGSYSLNGFEWWLFDVEGPTRVQDVDTAKIDYYPEGGGYWSSLLSSTTNIGEEIAIAGTVEDYFIEVMYDAILDGCGMTLGLFTDSDQGHAITLWGYEDDGEGNYWLYVTDSDDADEEDNGMRKLSMVYDEDDALWYLVDYDEYDDGWYVENVTTFAVGVLTVPEPATSLLSLMALAGLLARRRRKVA